MTILRTFHHPDHLGSSSWITDNIGRPIQHLHYLPFGEDWVDQRNSSWNAPYTFSGKEKDVETGYGYVKKLRFFSSLAFGNEKQVFHYAHCLRRFGARYYDSGLSIWLSVDPMAENTPFATPYAYCINNPIILYDPDGQDWFVNENTGQVFFNSEMGKDAAGTGNMKGDGWTWMGANDMFGEVNDEFFANNSEFNTGNHTFQAWETKGLDGERTNGYEMDFAGKSSAFMSKMGYDKVLKSAIAKVTTTISSIPDINGPNPESSKTEELFNSKYTYAKKGSFQSYTSSQLTPSRVSTSLLSMTSTSVHKEFRNYSYSTIKPVFNISQGTFNNILKYTKNVMDIIYDTKQATKK